jgi:hypothetical protein
MIATHNIGEVSREDLERVYLAARSLVWVNYVSQYASRETKRIAWDKLVTALDEWS